MSCPSWSPLLRDSAQFSWRAPHGALGSHLGASGPGPALSRQVGPRRWKFAGSDSRKGCQGAGEVAVRSGRAEAGPQVLPAPQRHVALGPVLVLLRGRPAKSVGLGRAALAWRQHSPGTWGEPVLPQETWVCRAHRSGVSEGAALGGALPLEGSRAWDVLCSPRSLQWLCAVRALHPRLRPLSCSQSASGLTPQPLPAHVGPSAPTHPALYRAPHWTGPRDPAHGGLCVSLLVGCGSEGGTRRLWVHCSLVPGFPALRQDALPADPRHLRQRGFGCEIRFLKPVI